jgi:hypothetical protein
MRKAIIETFIVLGYMVFCIATMCVISFIVVMVLYGLVFLATITNPLVAVAVGLTGCTAIMVAGLLRLAR